MPKITLNTSYLPEIDLSPLAEDMRQAQSALQDRSGAGSAYLGWLTLPQDYDRVEFTRIQAAAKRIQSHSDVLVVIGIGWSYLGSRAAIEFVGSSADAPEIIYLGNQMSTRATQGILAHLEGVDFSVNVISKSGTTTEPAIAFRLVDALLERKYGEHKKDRIFVTTDAQKWALKTLADSEWYETFVVPDDIWGRYSVLTAVGLLPIATAGIDIDKLMDGASEAMMDMQESENTAEQYAGIRSHWYRSGKSVELLVNYAPYAHYLGEWWKQLFGESEGKEWKWLYPDTLDYSTDLHSLGQYVQEWERLFLETVLHIRESDDLKVPSSAQDLDGLNYLADKPLSGVNDAAMQATILAHSDGGVPNMILELADTSAHTLGYFFYMMEYACAISGYMLGVNPFDQPGVEAYKTNMFALLQKPGYEDESKEIQSRL